MQLVGRFGLIALVVIPVGCGGTGHNTRTSQPSTTEPSGEGARRVTKVVILGNHAFSDSVLAGGLANRVRSSTGIFGRFVDSTAYDPVALDTDRLRLESYYKVRGYFSAKVTDVRVEKVGKDAVHIYFTIREGRRSTLTDVEIHSPKGPGALGFSVDELKKVSGLKVGGPVLDSAFSRAKRKLRSHYVDAGYAYAEVRGKTKVDRDLAQGSIVFEIDPGPKVKFGETHIVGLDRIPATAVLARLEWEQGETFDAEKLRKSQARLYGLGVFSVVKIEIPQQGRPEVADVTVSLAEGPRHEIKLGVGAGSDIYRYEARARFGYAERGWWMPLMTLRLDVRPSYSFLIDPAESNVQGLGAEARVGLTKEDFVVPLLTGSSTFTYELRRRYPAYTIEGPRLSLGLQRPFFENRLRVGVGWQLRVQEFREPERAIPDLGIDYPNIYRVGYFEQRIACDLRDDLIEPRRGLYAEVYLEESGAYAGSNFGYVRVTPEYRVYWPLGSRIVLGHRTRYGRQLSGDVLPITQRYFGGGASGQRGFGLQRLSPRLDGGLDSAPVGGRAMIETTIEARIDIVKLWGHWLGVAIFLDGGDTVRDPGDLDIWDLQWAAGSGLRWRLPIGPVRFDVALRLNRYGPGNLDPDQRWSPHVSIGEAF